MTQKELILEWQKELQQSKGYLPLTKDFLVLMKIMRKELLAGGSVPLPEIGKLVTAFKDSHPFKIKKKDGSFREGMTPKKHKIIFRTSANLKKELEIEKVK